MRPKNLNGITAVAILLVVCSISLLPYCAALALNEDPPQFAGWLTPVNLGPNVNTAAYEDVDPAVSKNGLSLYFSSRRSGGFGGYDIWVSQRGSVEDQWGTPQNLGPIINTAANETNPMLTIDGHNLYFASSRPDLGAGSDDIYVSRRHNKRDDFAWQAPLSLGSEVNSAATDTQPFLFEDDTTGVITLYFVSNRAGGLGNNDIYASTLQPDGTFGPASLVPALNTAADDKRPWIRRDGLEMFLVSNRSGSIPNLLGNPSYDIWTSTRSSTSDPWSVPVNVDPAGLLGINTGRHDGGPSLSFDGSRLYFHAAQRPGNQGINCPSSSTCYFDIWMATRNKLPASE